jgi:hypothetical protein
MICPRRIDMIAVMLTKAQDAKGLDKDKDHAEDMRCDEAVRDEEGIP